MTLWFEEVNVMRHVLVFICLIAIATTATALDIGNRMPVKPAVQSTCPPADPSLQGGDTIGTAFTIVSITPTEFHDTGTTAGYVNDYDEICPYAFSISPDVVYSYVAEAGVTSVTADLCYSSYDTKIYMWDASLDLLACNDDYYFEAPCFVYSSRIENVPVTPGDTYYIVVDGYGDSSGAYDIVVSAGGPPCDFTCPTPNTPEGEPEVYDGYVDTYNGGCQSSSGYTWTDLTYFYDLDNPNGPDPYGQITLCGTSGWYNASGGSQYRDTDWYYLQMGDEGSIDLTLDAAQPTYFFELGPQDCATVGVVQSQIGGDCNETSMTITDYAPGALVWFWAGPTTFAAPDGSHPYSYEYACWISGLYPRPVATEAVSWSRIKAIYQ